MLLESPVREVTPVCLDEMGTPDGTDTPVPPEKVVTECRDKTEPREIPV